MSDDISEDNESDGESLPTYGEMFGEFLDVADEQEILREETRESLRRVQEGESAQEDIEHLQDAAVEWIETRLGDDKN